MNLPSLTEITDKAQNAFKRFPIALLWAIFGTLFTIWLVDRPSSVLSKGEVNVVLTAILGVSWLIGTQFLNEQLNDIKKGIALKVVLLILLILFYFHLPVAEPFDDDPKFIIRFFLFLIAGHLFVFFAPFLFEWNRGAYWNYLKSIAFAIVRSGIFSGVLYLGLVLALLAIDALFEVRIDDDRYFQLFIFCLGIVNTWIYLSDFPKKIHQQTEILFNKALEVFVKYILIPLVILYIVILYAYGLKIVFEWELPKGWVSYLVTALALLGFIVQVVINPIQKKVKSWTINQFYPWFYILLLPLIALLFVAIFRRIIDYGITENRYLVLVVAFWVLGMTLFIVFSKKKSLVFLPITLFLVAIISSFGPWGASSISRKSQIKQFEKVFQSVRGNNKIATADQHGQLRSILEYLDERKSVNKLNRIIGVDIKEMFRDTISDDEKGLYVWFDSNKVLDSLGITIDPKTIDVAVDNNYFNYYTDQNQSRTYQLRDFDSMTTVSLNEYSTNIMETDNIRFHFDPKNVALKLFSKKDDNEVMVMPLKERLLELKDRGNYVYDIAEEEMTFSSRNDSISVKLIFSDLGFYIEKDSFKINHSKGILFLKQN